MKTFIIELMRQTRLWLVGVIFPGLGLLIAAYVYIPAFQNWVNNRKIVKKMTQKN